MANRPTPLAHLEKGKFIDVQENFVDTFNWLVAAVKNLTGGTNCNVEWTTPDTPTINVDDDYAPNGGGGGGGGDGVQLIVPAEADDGATLTWAYPSSEKHALFTTGENSNVKVSFEEDTEDQGSGKIKIDVYYV